ncbi:deoxyribodipyrimidine photo-lyase [bacterium]|nr:deoxyribodipyrimidine photo-lyase [candidate division CSSED10-310 bacterium]
MVSSFHVCHTDTRRTVEKGVTFQRNSRVHPARIRQLNDADPVRSGPAVYWMSRDQRAEDNWALTAAIDYSRSSGCPLIVVFCLVDGFLDAVWRQFDFMLTGLQETEAQLHACNIPFIILTGDPEITLPTWLKENRVGCLFTDFDPLRIKLHWLERVIRSVTIPVIQVDAHNIVPCWEAYPRAAFGAYILRRPLMRRMQEFLVDYPELPVMPSIGFCTRNPWRKLYDQAAALDGAPPVCWLDPGSRAAHEMLETFITTRLDQYSDRRNDPCTDAQSHLSPYIHFGQISAQRIVQTILASTSSSSGDMIEQVFIRRELSDNFCFYTPGYDRLDGFPAWARRTLDDHRMDTRYEQVAPERLESAETGDSLWNAAQRELVIRGKMHGYLRMYWAKKILEWSVDPETALATAIRLNDRYSLDGRDPNGYVGIAWSIGGVHDRAWGERPIVGKIRYMSRTGASRKFDIDRYIHMIDELERTEEKEKTDEGISGASKGTGTSNH